MNDDAETITVRMPRQSMGTLKALADDIACNVALLPDGTYLLRERDSNASVVPMRRRCSVVARHRSDLPQPPSGGEAA